uniref:Uncharacterized protein n=1 Tax=Spongospora subterranea TaxID=70186 RepID=A0A0H5QYV4_9EUKA|eukprot:CRZ07120.1 hypothetical protein [Spongospora subterranea]
MSYSARRVDGPGLIRGMSGDLALIDMSFRKLECDQVHTIVWPRSLTGPFKTHQTIELGLTDIQFDHPLMSFPTLLGWEWRSGQSGHRLTATDNYRQENDQRVSGSYCCVYFRQSGIV